jgi:hypothetical protein
MRKCVIALCVLLGAGLAHAKASAKSKVDHVLSSHQSWWKRWIVVGVVTPDEEGVFYYTRDDFLPPKSNTAFRIGSLTKTMTATLLALQNGTPAMSVGRCSDKQGLGGRRSLLSGILRKACPTCGKT